MDTKVEDKQYTQTGRAMFIIAWLIFFALLFLFFHYYDRAGGEPYQTRRGSITIPADKLGHYQIEGTINNHPVKFMIDTGASIVAIPEKLAGTMQLQGRYPIMMRTMSQKVSGSMTRIEQLSFGAFTLANIKAVIVPTSNDDDTVLLGMNVLEQFDISQENRTLTIKSRAPQ